MLETQKKLFHVPHDKLTDIALYQGGVGSGKTTAGVLLGYTLANIYPGSRGLVGAHTYSLLRDTTREVYKSVLDKSEIESWKSSPDNLVLKNGSEIWFRHLSDPGRLSSMEFSWIHIEEGAQVKADSFKALIARLRYNDFKSISEKIPKRYRIFITSNPEENYGYLYETFIEPEKPQDNVRYIRAPTSENHYLMELKPDYIELLKSMVDEDYAKIYLDGYTANITKRRVYRNFDRTQDVVDNIKLDPARMLHLSFDFNVDFMIALVIQDIGKNATHIIDEVVIKNGSDTESISKKVFAKYGHHLSGVTVHGDATGYSRHHRTQLSDYAIIKMYLGHMKNFRLKVKAGSANPSVRNRTNAVNFRFLNAKGIRRMKIHSRCKHLIKSLEQTRFEDGRFEKEKVRDASDPRFVVDHPGDALDYYMADEHPFQKQKLKIVPYV